MERDDTPGVGDMDKWATFGGDGLGSLHVISQGFTKLPPRLVPGFRSKPIYRVQAGSRKGDAQ